MVEAIELAYISNSVESGSINESLKMQEAVNSVGVSKKARF